MSQKNPCPPFIVLFLLFQTLAIIASATPLTKTISLLNSTIVPTASSKPLEDILSQDENATSPSPLESYFDYRITGTPLILRITELGSLFTQEAVNKIIDFGIRRVVHKINTGSGGEPIEDGRFWLLTIDIDMRINALANAELTYFLLGDVLAGTWQYMNQPLSTFREIVFNIILTGEAWEYIGHGIFSAKPGHPPPPPPPPEPTITVS